MSLQLALAVISTSLHLTAGASWSGPLERVEAIGEGAHAIVENGTRLIHYRKAKLPSYGRAASFIQPDEAAALIYEPEYSLGQLYNNNMFTLGYAPEVLHFCDAVLEGKPLTKGTLEAALEIMNLRFFQQNQGRRLGPALSARSGSDMCPTRDMGDVLYRTHG